MAIKCVHYTVGLWKYFFQNSSDRYGSFISARLSVNGPNEQSDRDRPRAHRSGQSKPRAEAAVMHMQRTLDLTNVHDASTTCTSFFSVVAVPLDANTKTVPFPPHVRGLQSSLVDRALMS